MKKVFVLTGMIVFAALAAFAGSKSDEKTSLKVDTKASKIYWTGKKITGEHTGYLSLNDGTVSVKEGEIISASLKMDMNSIECTDLQGEWKDKLVGHLKSDDFFSVEKNPTATFDVKSVKKTGTQSVVTGDLTIKGITNEVSFPVEVKNENNTLTANGTAKLDRTKWDIRYGSGKFFDSLGDNMIYDDFEIRFELVAKDSEDLTSL
ncbi:MAG TPA: YceI family protein [Draconibacterium sp.]|nr:YceI family protein [Draconibacterium sp.]